MTGDGARTAVRELPCWAKSPPEDWGERVRVLEWDEGQKYRNENGWKVRKDLQADPNLVSLKLTMTFSVCLQGEDLIHSPNAAVRILDYFVKYGDGEGTNGMSSGGIGTRLTGIVFISKRAESHQGFCHGGSMCSLMDDILSWCAFQATGTCMPWCGYSVQVNTSLRKAIPVETFLLATARITKIERRKVTVEATLIDPSGESEVVHAEGTGLVILKRGVLPEESSP